MENTKDMEFEKRQIENKRRNLQYNSMIHVNIYGCVYRFYSRFFLFPVFDVPSSGWYINKGGMPNF